jgi:gliding motility-associated-like protein
MKFLYYKLTIISIFVFSNSSIAQNIVVDDTYSAQQLVENVLVNSPCASVSNFSVSGDTFSTGAQSYGYFSYSGSNFPFSNGIVLSTSRASRTQGPNNNLIDEGATSWQGDLDLEQALEISGTFNATALEFDFTPLTSKISFDYIFASEEYQGTAPCRYSDGFAFLLKVAGSSDEYQNLALIPGTTTPVKVTTVHPEIQGSSGCDAENETFFGSYNDADHPINFNGQTVVMTAEATVIPGVTYHIKLVIADEENIRYDSAIFLGGGSFDVGVDLGENRLIATQNPLCPGENVVLDATQSGSNTYQWFKDGIAIAAETNPIYNVTDDGFYEVEVAINGSTCVAKGEITIEYSTAPVLVNQTISQCDINSDGITNYNLSVLNSLITNGDSQLGNVTYYENLSDAQLGINSISNPSNYQNLTTNQLTATASNSFGCIGFATIDLQISTNSVPTIAPISTCDLDVTQDGLTLIDLNSTVTPTLLSGFPSTYTASYYANENDAILNNSPLNTNFNNTIPNQQTIYGKVLDGINCIGITPIQININTFSPPNFDDETVYLCNGNSVILSVTGGFSSYNWSNSETDNSIVVTSSGTYSVIVSDANGCEKTKNFNVILSSRATINDVIINDFAGYNNSIEIIATGSGVYEYSLDGINYQNSPIFSGLSPNAYTVYVNDTNECGFATQEVYVLDYPRFFTPNGDGTNDVWRIKRIQFLDNALINIFDRFGKLIISINQDSIGWNGKYNGIDLPSTDYWFVITLNNGRTIKGNFSLKR